jgi:hypothetical protein
MNTHTTNKATAGSGVLYAVRVDKAQQQFTGLDWSVANKTFVMGPVGARNQERLCWRGPAEIYWNGVVSSQPPVREQGPLRKEEGERITLVEAATGKRVQIRVDTD